MDKSYTNTPRLSIRIAAAFAVIFGILTIFSGGSVLFGPQTAQDAAGSFVPFVVWSNFLAGFFYILAGFGMWFGTRWAGKLAIAIAAVAALTALVFVATVMSGGAYEMRTVGASALRFGVWASFSILLLKKSA